MQLFLSVTAAQTQEASRYTRALAHRSYRIGPESTLLRQSMLLQTRGGLLSVSSQESPRVEDPEALCAAVLRECSRRGYSGAVLDFQVPIRIDLERFAGQLSRTLSANRRALYVPESYAPAAPGAIVLISTALSGGSLQERLRDALQQYSGRAALLVERVRMDFTLPARTGEGTPLTALELEALMERESPSVFFSQDLCARYFTYTQGGQGHFVLFDDGETIAHKLRTGTALGFSAAFLCVSQVQDLLPSLFPRRS